MTTGHKHSGRKVVLTIVILIGAIVWAVTR
jgi:hypothetical protein